MVSETRPWMTGTAAPPMIDMTMTAPPVSVWRLSSMLSRVRA